MNFDIKDLPYGQFERLGMNKKDVLSMKSDDLVSLLTGRRTSLHTFTIKDAGLEPLTVDAKLSLKMNPDNTLSLLIHPIRREIQNEIGASKQELEKLQNGELLVKPFKSLNGEKELYVFQLDKETNEILRVRVRDIQVPSAIRDIVLSTDQKEHLRQGGTLELYSKAKDQLISAHLDLNEPKGLKIVEGQISVKESHTLAVKETPVMSIKR
ncbi:DUF4099 domain-containing protein [Pontibacter sp. SGAir0037]|uniref:DUF4099 domain-containing protein n=1 Tax=Pontibacter sp. SGAir0037 TaxID=2571030 RepID=UPI0010CD4F63|nr:DUF4099 domain-containing protein [Pontibacter sp. SGAir0037]QCR25278.1 hypothetical protein C1N53_22430 [Pontibacter sp. SGAir0037]